MNNEPESDDRIPREPKIKPPSRIKGVNLSPANATGKSRKTAGRKTRAIKPKSGSSASPAQARKSTVSRGTQKASGTASATTRRSTTTRPSGSTARPGAARRSSTAKDVAAKYTSSKSKRRAAKAAGTNAYPALQVWPVVFIGIVLVIGVIWLVAAAGIHRARQEAAFEAKRRAAAREEQQDGINQQHTAQIAARNVMKDLKARADKLVEQGRHIAAITLYTRYKGPYARETLAQRTALARAIDEKHAAAMRTTMPSRSSSSSRGSASPPPAGPAAKPPPEPEPEEDITIEIF